MDITYEVDRKTELKNGKVIADYVLISKIRAYDGTYGLLSKTSAHLRVEPENVRELINQLTKSIQTPC